MAAVNIDEKGAIYFFQSYNLSGELSVVPKSQVKFIDVSWATGEKSIVSGRGRYF